MQVQEALTNHPPHWLFVLPDPLSSSGDTPPKWHPTPVSIRPSLCFVSFSSGPPCLLTPRNSSLPALSVHILFILFAQFHHTPAGLLHPLPIPHRPWSHIAVDFVMGLPPSEGNNTILTVADHFSKSVHFIPFPKLPSALETTNLPIQHVFSLHSIPQDIVSEVHSSPPEFRRLAAIWWGHQPVSPLDTIPKLKARQSAPTKI